ncbi:MAG: SDR family NAD(P)-dependent oxidoreductase [Intestinibacillus sp.]
MRALITGASSGLGRDMARELARRGYDLVLVARRKERLRLLAAELPVHTEIIQADLTDAQAVFDLYHRARGDDLAVIVNCAGFGLFGPFDKTDLDAELRMLDVNCRAVHILTKLFLRDFKARNQGYILNVASSASFMAGPLMATYYATKNYVLRLTQAIREELRQEGSAVKVCALCPGPVHTEFNQVAQVRFTIPGLDSRRVAAYAIAGLLRGRGVLVPGMQMKAVLALRHLMPEALVTRVAYHIQHRKNG